MSDDMDEYPLLTSSAQMERETPHLEIEKVVVRPWRKTVFVRELTGSQQDEHKRGNFQREGSGLRLTLRKQDLRLAALSIVDGNGNRIFPDTARGADIIGEWGAGGLAIVVEACNRLNKQDDAAKKELEGNSESELTADSPSDSPATSDSR
jgi:hypothetical protein